MMEQSLGWNIREAALPSHSIVRLRLNFEYSTTLRAQCPGMMAVLIWPLRSTILRRTSFR
jgi:hypothetical protein